MTADILATKEELASFMQDNAMDCSTAELVLELATGEVQSATLQRLVAVADDEITLMGTTDSWLALPERPVTAVASVTIDGTTLTAGTSTGYKRFGARLWRRCGWASCWTEPSEIGVVYSHGLAVGDQALQPARAGVLALGRLAHGNPGGLLSEAIDDYRAQWAAAVSAAAESAPHLMQSLRRRYGTRAGLVRIG